MIGGPDVWEVSLQPAAHRSAARSSSVRSPSGSACRSRRSGVAVSYYGEYPDEVDQFIAANEQEAEQLERALENERRLLG